VWWVVDGDGDGDDGVWIVVHKCRERDKKQNKKIIKTFETFAKGRADVRGKRENPGKKKFKEIP
jgi:hypothetical protein